MLDEETVEYGVCLILVGLVERTLPLVWDDVFRDAKEGHDGIVAADETLRVRGTATRAWLTLR